MTLFQSNQTNRLRAVHLILFIAILLASSGQTASAKDSLFFKATVSGQGTPVVLIPGMMSDGRVWDDTVSELESNHQVHVLEPLGFGRNRFSGHYTLAALERQLSRYIRTLDQPVLIGHSFGGLLAMSIALKSPDTIDRVVSVDGLPFIGPVFTGSSATQAQDLEQQANQFKHLFASLTADQFDAQLRRDLNRQAVTERTQSDVFEMSRQSNRALVGELISAVMITDLRDQLRKLNTPLLILGASGGFDNEAAKQHIKGLYQQQVESVPNAKILMHNHARHFIMLDDPAWFVEQLTRFINEAS